MAGGETRALPDHERCSEVEVSFVAQGPSTTRVDLRHYHLERHGDDLRPQLDGIRSGWRAGRLDLYAGGLAAR